jgi:soluble lytic murein transglycosylase-like protein
MRWICILIACVAAAQPAAQPPTAVSSADLMRAAIQKQRLAVRQQAQSARAWLLPWTDEPAISGPRPCEPIADPVAAPLIETAAKANQIQAPLLHAVIEQESAFHPCAVSSKGAQGLMQLMPDTAGALGVKDTFDPRQNIEAGARYLKQLLDKYKGDLKLALGAYNAGPAAIDAIGAIPDIPETRDYVDAILKKIK